jgi:hypothetical protein
MINAGYISLFTGQQLVQLYRYIAKVIVKWGACMNDRQQPHTYTYQILMHIHTHTHTTRLQCVLHNNKPRVEKKKERKKKPPQILLE